MYIDTETTGLDKENDDIIQLAGIISANGQKEEFDFKIRPRPGTVLTDSAFQAHLITNEEMQAYPPASEVFPKFMALLNKYVNRYDRMDKFFFVAYNADFDMNFLRKLFDHQEERYFSSWFFHPALDVMQIANFHLLGKRHQMKNFKLITVYEELMGHPFENAHDALADIRATKEVLNKIVENQKKL